MDPDSWETLREQADRLDPGAELRTPVSERPFVVEATYDDRVAVRFEDSDEPRSLWRDQFDVLTDRLDDPLPVDELAPGVEPYAVLLSLLADYRVEDGELRHDPGGGEAGESPYLVPPEEARRQPELLHDDAVLLAELVERVDADDPDTLDTETLTDLYVLLSDVQRGADRLRRGAREPLLERLGPDQRLHGRYGTVRRTTRERRSPKDEATVLSALDEHGIPHEWVLGVDADKLDVVLAVTDLDADAVYDVDEQTYVQKTGVDEREKYERLRGLADRVDELEGEEREELRAEVDELEQRLGELLSAD